MILKCTVVIQFRFYTGTDKLCSQFGRGNLHGRIWTSSLTAGKTGCTLIKYLVQIGLTTYILKCSRVIIGNSYFRIQPLHEHRQVLCQTHITLQQTTVFLHIAYIGNSGNRIHFKNRVATPISIGSLYGKSSRRYLIKVLKNSIDSRIGTFILPDNTIQTKFHLSTGRDIHIQIYTQIKFIITDLWIVTVGIMGIVFVQQTEFILIIK